MKVTYLLSVGSVLGLLVFHTSAATLCVDINGTNGTPPYADWSTAATNIQDAIDAASPGDTVLVTNGIYASGGRVMAGDLTNRVVLDKAITVTSVGGPTVTFIEGVGATAGAAAVRGAWLTNGAVLDGFTICFGATRTTGDVPTLQSGGGVWCVSSNSMLSNCVITTNTSSNYGLGGGGAYQGTLMNCQIIANISGMFGGGAYQGILSNCQIVANSAVDGGGACLGSLSYCLVVSNSASSAGGGVYQSTARNCQLLGNYAYNYGGGAYQGWLSNCQIVANLASQGGGAYLGSLSHSLVVSNSASSAGGGVYQSTVSNCQILANSSRSFGGGAYMASLSQCSIVSNSANANGGGVFQCTNWNCQVLGNVATLGGGAYQGALYNSLISGNRTGTGGPSGGGANGATLVNCTITGNSYDGVALGVMTNCIVYLNSPVNYSYSPVSWYSCTTPQISGHSNITANPQLLPDGIHLANNSPCLGAGTNVAGGTDLYGHPWANPPSMGCVEWQPQPIVFAPVIQLSTAPFGFIITAPSAGDPSSVYYWTRDGNAVQNGGRYSAANAGALAVSGFSPTDAGGYQVVVSNAFGMATSAVTQVTFHFVDAAGQAPTPPYLTWVNAATNVQDAIDAAAAGDFVIVTNGLYATGGRVMAGDLLNRVALNKPLTLTSVGGYAVTVLQGCGVTPTNGPSAVRCAWLTNGALLNGFTLQGGGTRTSGDGPTLQCGGGAWCAGTNAIVANCLIATNAANSFGGGAYQVILNNCLVVSNSAVAGGGVYAGILNNCAVTRNRALSSTGGGGANYSTLVNCTVTSNVNYGVSYASATNCVLYFNSIGNFYNGSLYAYCCTTPLPSGPGNISSDPQLLGDGIHEASTSPCRGAGTNTVVSGVDIDGQAWANPPSIGCDEWQPAPVIVIQPAFQPIPLGLMINVSVVGQGPFTCWWTRNGTPIDDGNGYSSAHTTSLAVSDTSLLFGASYQVVISNSFGMATSSVVQATFHYVAANGTAPMLPYSSWTTAATNIQDAIDAALPGEIIVVTNGIYASGGKVMAGDLTNRVAIDKPLLVQSVNGPAATAVTGCWDPSITTGPVGPAAVRCAWLTNGAVLCGFTLYKGATRSGGFTNTLYGGGGVCGASTNAIVFNCVIVTNAAYYQSGGGGAVLATLINCRLSGNSGGSGGGAAGCNLQNCAIIGNSGAYGGGVFGGTLQNCTITGNWGTYNGGAYASTLTNCIVQANLTHLFMGPSNYSSCTLSYCCAAPLPAGPGNISADPQLLGDSIHLASTSPCRETGLSSVVSGVDIDGQSWANPPSIGCDQWQPVPQIVVQPSPQFSGPPDTIYFGAVSVAGQDPFGYFWSKDGQPLASGGNLSISNGTNLLVSGFGPADTGSYCLVVSNAYGMTTSQVAKVVIHCVDAAGAAPASPYSGWSTAATNIQDAIDAASVGDCVLVTNGIYSNGGKVMDGDLTSRVALNKALTVVSVNGYRATVIQGVWDPISTNGPGAVRCAWLTNGATLSGFTLQGGATRSTGAFPALCGGGVTLPASSATIANCLISNNAAAAYGGGVNGLSYSTVRNCQILQNYAQYGGGACAASLCSCLLQGNRASSQGGGAYQTSMLDSCTIVGNSATGTGGGAWLSLPPNGISLCLRDSIVYFNTASQNANAYFSVNPSPPTAIASCSTPTPLGAANISADPQLVDSLHLSVNSPCRGTGTNYAFTAADLDGDAWGVPPSMGCTEVVLSELVGPLSVSVQSAQPQVLVNRSLSLTGLVTGRAANLAWDFGDGQIATNVSFITSHTWTNSGDYTVTCTAYNNDNPLGVSGSMVVHILPLTQPLLEAPCVVTNSFQFQFAGQAGASYQFQMATNLTPPVSWQTLQTLSCTGGVVQLTDTAPTNTAQFYRLLAQ